VYDDGTTSTLANDRTAAFIDLQILNIIRRIGNEPDLERALSQVLDSCMAETDATTGRLYLLDLPKSVYRCHHQTSKHNRSLEEPADLPVAPLLDSAKSSDPILREVLNQKRYKCFCLPSEIKGDPLLLVGDRARLVVPIIRRQTCLGLIDLGSQEPDRFGTENIRFVEAVSTLALLLLEKKGALNLLKELPAPIDFQLDWDTFLEQLILVVSLASRMPHIILREWIQEEDCLACLKVFGFDGAAMQAMDLKPVSNYPQFFGAVTSGTTQAFHAMDYASAEWVSAMPQLEGVRSLVVVPVKVGNQIFGTLSFAGQCEYDYSEMEIAGFETIAASIGVSITNWRAARKASDILFNKARASAMITANEVAQSARHSITNFTAESEIKLHLLEKGIATLPAKQLQKAEHQIDEIRENLNGINWLVNMIKSSAQVPDRIWTKVDVGEIWREAFDMVSGRLVNYGIKVQITAVRLEAVVCREFLRQAFLQLIFNSIDALRECRKSNRQIKVVLQDEGLNSNYIRIRYTDNGTGVNLSKLKLPPLQGTRKPEIQDIWREGVTSKSDSGGSGFGLYEVGHIIKEHGSFIDLIDYRSGVTFDIRIAKARMQRLST
jgi:GAF domain-containing protein